VEPFTPPPPPLSHGSIPFPIKDFTHSSPTPSPNLEPASIPSPTLVSGEVSDSSVDSEKEAIVYNIRNRQVVVSFGMINNGLEKNPEASLVQRGKGRKYLFSKDQNKSLANVAARK